MYSQNFGIHYQIQCFDPKAHLLKVSLTIESPTQPEQIVRLPNWIPGSYLLRNFAKHLVNLSAKETQSGKPVQIEAVDLCAWKFHATQSVTVEYFIYAWDLSVRKAHFDETHAFFNGTSTFLAVEGQRDRPVKVSLVSSEITNQKQWQAATGMPVIEVDANGFGDYYANNYRDLVEYPFEIGNFVSLEFIAANVPHKMVFTGRFDQTVDWDRIRDDVQKICQTEIDFFGQAAPMTTYLFQVMVTGSDYGGLEHVNSTALICARGDLPFLGMDKPTDGYLQFLELCSHEYFHTWNVKRIMPKVYQQSDLNQPAISEQLWWFEGVTSYYDALFLLSSGRIDETTYLDLLGKQLTRVYQMPGRFLQSVAQSSFYTWTKFYQQDEDAPNSIISYYTKGSVIALALDLTLRKQTQNRISLDDIVRHLWTHYGSQGIGLEEKQIEQICSELCLKFGGQSLEVFFATLLYGTNDFDFESLFSEFGYDFILRPAQNSTDMGGQLSIETLEKLLKGQSFTLGARLQDLPAGGVKVTHVWNQQSLYQAGITSGDEIIALNGLRIQTKAQIDQMLQRYQNGQTWECHYFRRDELYTTTITPQQALKDRVTIVKSKAPAKFQWLSTAGAKHDG